MATRHKQARTYCEGRIWCGSSSWRSREWPAPSSSRQTGRLPSATEKQREHISPTATDDPCHPTRVEMVTLSMGSMRKSLKRYHCWCVTPCRSRWNRTVTCSDGWTAASGALTALLSHLFSLMVRLPHFDVCNQVPARTCVQHVGHRDHQVVERRPLCLLGCTQLIPGE